MPLITLEEHYLSKATVPHIVPMTDAETDKAFLSPDLHRKLADFSSVRLEQMNASGINIQVISHTPLPTATPLPSSPCITANDGPRDALQSHPDRFAASACFPTAEPLLAADELRHCITDPSFVGTLIDNHFPDGPFYDSERFHPVFTAAQDLDVPSYLHPSFPTRQELDSRYTGNYGGDAQVFPATAAWGWHADVGLHVLKLFAASVVDRFPRLRVILGRVGEMLPFSLERILSMEKGLMPDSRDGEVARRGFRAVGNENSWVTASGMFSVDPMACLLRNTKVDRIMFSVDWPMSGNGEGIEFLRKLEGSGLVIEEELDVIRWKNAARLLRLKAFQGA